MIQLLCTVLSVFQLALFGRAILSWFPLRPGTGPAQVANLLARVTEPVLGPVRRALPFLRTGGIDLSFLVVLVLVNVVQRSLGCSGGFL